MFRAGPIVLVVLAFAAWRVRRAHAHVPTAFEHPRRRPPPIRQSRSLLSITRAILARMSPRATNEGSGIAARWLR